MHLCKGCEAADYLHKAQNFDDSTLCASGGFRGGKGGANAPPFGG